MNHKTYVMSRPECKEKIHRILIYRNKKKEFGSSSEWRKLLPLRDK